MGIGAVAKQQSGPDFSKAALSHLRNYSAEADEDWGGSDGERAPGAGFIERQSSDERALVCGGEKVIHN
jgi:hypothetical protein